MPKKIDLTEIIKKNPHIDPKQFRESMELLEELRKRGVSERGYQLVPPFSGKRIQVVDNSSEDPRTVHLKRN